jgi:hypothetical protein
MAAKITLLTQPVENSSVRDRRCLHQNLEYHLDISGKKGDEEEETPP